VSRRFGLTDAAIRKALDALAQDHREVARAVAQVGYPPSRRREHSFESLARIVMGQQLSVKAAATIAQRVDETVGGALGPETLLATAPDQLRAAGLSRQKISYLQSLAEAVISGDLPIETLPELADEEVEAAITAVRGFGRWSAHMYMMFALGRPDIWPSGDLAVRVGFGRIMGWKDRPDEKRVIDEGGPFSPYRSALALLCWQFYSEAPL
jgi:DNA-3-methyladenine glycosylase II|tara:strand:- start:144 stop:776 length:633 start_codon:yes stop_codon:yes gene_type:complete